MGAKTHIEWTDATWNPFGGCSVFSRGCTNCYAMRIAGSGRLRNHPLYAGVTSPSKAGPVFNGRLTTAATDADVWTWPTRWRGSKTPKRGAGQRSMIFVGDMADLFHEGRPDEVIDRVFAVMALSPQHDFQVLTKRAARMRQYLSNFDEYSITETDEWRSASYRVACDDAPNGSAAWHNQTARLEDAIGASLGTLRQKKPLPNVWCGVSVEDQATADERIPLLLDTPAAKRFISAEPLLESVTIFDLDGPIDIPDGMESPLDWVIAGGESGPNDRPIRPMHPDWVRSLRDQCAAADVPFFFKQWGEWTYVMKAGDPGFDEIPDCLPADTVPTRVYDGCIMLPNGLRLEQYLGRDAYPPEARCMVRVGKKAAGAMLDGREHRGFPA